MTIPQPFALGIYEVTFSEWDSCLAGGCCGGYRPEDKGWGRGEHPVIIVSWVDAKAYLAWLSRETGHEYRLLSESEWEYAARAGTTTNCYWGNEFDVDRANKFDANRANANYNLRRTVSVGRYAANGFGLYDMHGNVWEWVEDCWHESYAGAPADGRAWTSGGDCGRRVLRGGAWSFIPTHLRAASRAAFSDGGRGNSAGFRVARTLRRWKAG